MRRTSLLGLLALMFSATMLGCNNNLQDENTMLREEAQNLRAQLADRNEALEAAGADRRELAMTNAELRRQLDDAQSRPAPQAERRTGFEGIEGVDASFRPGQVAVNIASDVLFDSGKAELRQAAQRSLNQVAQVLSTQYSGRTIRIEGHTDSDPIVRSGWKSNHHLGAERAYSVMEYLRTRGVAANNMYIASFGPTNPRGTKAQSRRVEIIVMTGSQ